MLESGTASSQNRIRESPPYKWVLEWGTAQH